MKHYLKLTVVLLILFGCSSNRDMRKSHSIAEFHIKPEFNSYIQDSESCTNPITATVTLNREFKYGCFCGENYPSIRHSSGKSDKDLLPYEKKELIKSYYRIKPVDDIDLACQAHDICYIDKGGPDISCNLALMVRLNEITRYMNSRRNFFDAESVEWRCQILADDMETVFNTLFTEGVSESERAYFIDRVSKYTLTPILVAITVIFRPLVWWSEPYPLEGETCNIINDKELYNG